MLLGCSEGFEVDDADAGASLRDGAAGDGAAGDGAAEDASFQDASPQDTTFVDEDDASAPRDRCEPPNPCSGSCELPWLLATAQDLFGEGRCGGRVFRYSLSGPAACACDGYETPDDDYPTTASYIPGGTVLVGTSENAFTFGASRMERYLGGTSAIDSFIIEGEEEGSDPVGILLAGTPGGGGGKSIFVFGAGGGFDARGFGDPTTITSVSATQNPNNRRGYRSADIGRPSVNRLFWEDALEDLMHFAGGQRGMLEAFYANGLHRTVVTVPEGVRHVANGVRTLDNSPATVACGGAEYEDCTYAAAAPDPFSADHVYVACEQPIEDRRASRIARLDLRDDSCVDLLPFEHWRRIRVTHLSIGLEDYWVP